MLTFVILAGFATIVGVLTDRQVMRQFSDQVHREADRLASQLSDHVGFVNGSLQCRRATVNLSEYTSAEHAQIRIFDNSGYLLCTQDDVRIKGAKPPPAVPQFPAPSAAETSYDQYGYRVVVRPLSVEPDRTHVILLYALPLSDIDHTLGQVRFFLLLGVLGGTVMALLAGLVTAQRATRPIRQLTQAAREIARTRDPSLRVPHPEAEDEVAELARTLEEMLGALDSARSETEIMLERQREFVADASHELRTPLTSVLANLELLAEELHGEQAETAEAALRSTRRMRRLVGDLLLLARADAARVQPRGRVDVAEVVNEVAVELGALAEGHSLRVDAQPAEVLGVRDDLHRLVLNLVENALRHTPAGTVIRIRSLAGAGEALVIVEDDGPGIPPELERRLFERFVRGGRDGGRGSGLGLSIVRAVAELHGGSVSLERPRSGGSRFIIRLPLAPAAVAPAGAETSAGSVMRNPRS